MAMEWSFLSPSGVRAPDPGESKPPILACASKEPLRLGVVILR